MCRGSSRCPSDVVRPTLLNSKPGPCVWCGRPAFPAAVRLCRPSPGPATRASCRPSCSRRARAAAGGWRRRCGCRSGYVGSRPVAGRGCVSRAAARRQRRREDECEAQDRKGAVRAGPVRDHQGYSIALSVTDPLDRLDHLLASDPVRRAGQQAAHRGTVTGDDDPVGASVAPFLVRCRAILSHQPLG
jgi:hypothetical protein